jgi:hypothetical protein
MRALALASALFLVAGHASAAIDPVAARAFGDWRLSEVGGRIACTLTLTDQSMLRGFQLRAPLACRRAFPALRSVAAWAVDDRGGIVLSDSNAQPIVTFPAALRGPYETKAPDGRTWRLEPVRTGAETPPAPPPPAPAASPAAPAG